MSWREKIKYDEHLFENVISSISDYQVSIIIKSRKDSAGESSKLLIEKIDFIKILNKESKVIKLSTNTLAILEGSYSSPVCLNDFDIDIKLGNDVLKEVLIEDFINEFKIKNSPKEIEALRLTTVKTGEYFQYGKDILRDFYFSNEEKLEKFKSLIYQNNFCFPTNKHDRQELIKYIDEKAPEVKGFLLSNIPTLEERMYSTKSKIFKR